MAKNSTTQTVQKDVYRRITDKIITAIEAGADDWKMPWHNENGSIRPVNAISGKPYRGVNIVSLWASAQDQGYDCPQWATYRQWDEIGAQVRKGEKASLVVFWKIRDNDTEAESEGQDDDKASSRLIVAKGYSVFNAAQVDGYVVPCTTPAPVAERIEHADKFFAATGMQLRHGGNKAFYRPATDHIQMPHTKLSTIHWPITEHWRMRRRTGQE